MGFVGSFPFCIFVYNIHDAISAIRLECWNAWLVVGWWLACFPGGNVRTRA